MTEIIDGTEIENETLSELTIVFVEKNGQRHPVRLRRSSLQPLIALLQSKIEAGSVTPLNRGGIAPGTSFALEAFQPIKKPDGTHQVVFYIRLPDQNSRGVTMPVDLSEDDRVALIRGLGGTP